MTNTQFTAEGLFVRLSERGYLDPLKRLCQALSGHLWIVGGWVRSSFLGAANYSGDLDCVCTLPEDEAIRRVSPMAAICRNRNNGLRIGLPDGNSIDIMPAEQFSLGLAIEEVLPHFNFSVNSAAVGLDGVLVSTAAFQRDMASRTFALNPGFRRNPASSVKLHEDAERLMYYDRLAPGGDALTVDLVKEIQAARTSLDELSDADKLVAAEQIVRKFIGHKYPAWLVRGYVRCVRLGGLQYWDDLDVVIDCPRTALDDLLKDCGCTYALNHHGNPKVFCDNGGTMDVWCLGAGHTIHDELETYAHSVDAVAWRLGGNVTKDRLYAGNCKDVRIVSIPSEYVEGAAVGDLSYSMFKTVYLCCRHRLRPDAATVSLLRRDLPTNGFFMMNAVRLAKELCCVAQGAVGGRLEEHKVACGTSPAFELLESLCLNG